MYSVPSILNVEYFNNYSYLSQIFENIRDELKIGEIENFDYTFDINKKATTVILELELNSNPNINNIIQSIKNSFQNQNLNLESFNSANIEDNVLKNIDLTIDKEYYVLSKLFFNSSEDSNNEQLSADEYKMNFLKKYLEILVNSNNWIALLATDETDLPRVDSHFGFSYGEPVDILTYSNIEEKSDRTDSINAALFHDRLAPIPFGPLQALHNPPSIPIKLKVHWEYSSA